MNVAEHYGNIFGYSVSWVFLGKSFDNSFKVICKLPFGTDLYITKRI